MKLKNHDKLLALDKAITAWEFEESGRTIDFQQHLQEGLHEQAESIKCMIESDIGDMMIERQRMESVFAEAWVALYFVKMKYSLTMDSDSFQKTIDEHCDFLIDQYKTEDIFLKATKEVIKKHLEGAEERIDKIIFGDEPVEEEVDYSTMEF